MLKLLSLRNSEKVSSHIISTNSSEGVSIDRLDIQIAALRIALAIPRPVPTAFIYAEAGEPPRKTDIKGLQPTILSELPQDHRQHPSSD